MNWKSKKLGDIASIITGKKDANEGSLNGQYRFYTCAKDYSYIENYSFDTEAILISGNGAYVGYVHYYKGKFDAYQRTYILTDFNEDVFYMKYFLDRALPLRIHKEKQDTATPYIKMGALYKFPVYLPICRKEQTAIAAILSSVDNSIQATKEIINKAERLKKALMQNLFSGKLKPDGTWRTEDEYYTDEKYGKVPTGWKIDKLRLVTKKITDGEHLTPDLQEQGELLLSAEDVFEDGIRFEKVKYVKKEDWSKFRSKCNPEYGDVLLVSRGASIGRTCKVETDKLFSLMGSVILIKPNNSLVLGDYISQYLKSYKAKIDLLKLSGTTAQQAIYMTDLNKLKMVYPEDIIEQRNISSQLDTVDNFYSGKSIKLGKLKRLKISLMQNLLTGKVRVDVNKVLSLINTCNEA